VTLLRLSASQAIDGRYVAPEGGGEAPVLCSSCRQPMFADHVSESLTGQCRSCQISDEEDYAGITREEARREQERD
jgi:hypothetical protein